MYLFYNNVLLKITVNSISSSFLLFAQTSDLNQQCSVFFPLDHSLNMLQQQDESIEDVIKDTESLFKSREKEYQDTIDQIEVSSVFVVATNTGSKN